jgi:hypothetical protein
MPLCGIGVGGQILPQGSSPHPARQKARHPPHQGEGWSLWRPQVLFHKGGASFGGPEGKKGAGGAGQRSRIRRGEGRNTGTRSSTRIRLRRCSMRPSPPAPPAFSTPEGETHRRFRCLERSLRTGTTRSRSRLFLPESNRSRRGTTAHAFASGGMLAGKQPRQSDTARLPRVSILHNWRIAISRIAEAWALSLASWPSAGGS